MTLSFPPPPLYALTLALSRLSAFPPPPHSSLSPLSVFQMDVISAGSFHTAQDRFSFQSSFFFFFSLSYHQPTIHSF